MDIETVPHPAMLYNILDQSGLSLCRMNLKFSAQAYFLMRNSNLNSVSTKNQHEIFSTPYLILIVEHSLMIGLSK